MSVIIRAALQLLPGCTLLYDCPLGSDDWNSDQFFKAYRGKRAEFVGYSEKLVGILDHQGRAPGRYIDLGTIQVRFEGEEEILRRTAGHFIVLDAEKALVVSSAGENQRLGDLPHPILFYLGDKVRLKKNVEGITDTEHYVDGVFLGKPFTKNDIPRYHVVETPEEAAERKRLFDEENAKREPGQRLVSVDLFPHGWSMAGEDLELVECGNVWALYNDPSKLSFGSDEEELEFWMNSGLSVFVPGGSGLPLQAAAKRFLDGEADIFRQGPSNIQYSDNPKDEPRYNVMRLHSCWQEHRARVRALTERMNTAAWRELVSV